MKPTTYKVLESFTLNSGKTTTVRIGTAVAAADGTLTVALDILPRSPTFTLKLESK